MKPHQVERRTHDYKRHGTTTLDIATGEVTGVCYDRHRNQEFLDFLKLLNREYPRVQLHLILDNASTHKTPTSRPGWRSIPAFTFISPLPVSAG